jgi:hypothetical protein
MSPIAWFVGGLILAAGIVGCYGLHRLALWLESRGWIYYVRRTPSWGSSCFSALQEAIEPQSRHVFHISEERRSSDEDDTPGVDGGWSRPLWIQEP